MAPSIPAAGRTAGSVCPCAGAGSSLRAGEGMTTSSDGDPAFSVDASTGMSTLADDAEGRFGAFTITGSLASPR
ncbi:MAG: hypothetical protein AB7S26_05545 [Sandaracinaceae bacterium]